MVRRMALLVLLVMVSATSVWPKWKEEDQKYLDDHFQAVQDQIQALATHIQALNTQLTELRQNQVLAQQVIVRQQRALQDLDQMVSSIRLGNEENFSTLKKAIEKLRAEDQAAFSKLSGLPAQQVAGGAAEGVTTPRTAPAPKVIQGYVTVVEGNDVMIDIGSTQGVHEGTRLALYKASDPNTRVGVMEVTQVVDSGNSRARIVTVNSGVQPEFSDIVRVE
jgi:hypothetical protein